MKTFYITTPIYYLNASPHIGHAYTTILADVLARCHRLMGDATFFLTGTDEHGQKVAQAAARAGLTPKAYVDEAVKPFQALWRKLEVTNDDFIRTTEPRHTAVVQAILQDLFERGEIFRTEYDGWYCVACERFVAEEDLVDGKCPEPGCGRPVERLREANYFFRMSRYQEWLVDHIRRHPEFIQPDFRRNETLGFLRQPLKDLCISRPKSRLAWGIELPFDRDYVTYVWFDALVNYLSAVGYRWDAARFGAWWPASCHLIGKDILTTHTVYWPTMLQAMGVPLPRTVFAHGWWLAGENKMSKTAGNVVNPMDVADRYGVDAFRYFLMAEMTPGKDAAFTTEAFVRRYNADLANDLGNLLSRVLKMVHTARQGVLPAPGPAGAGEDRLREAVLSAASAMIEGVDSMRLDQGLAAVIGAVREANRYFERREPWHLATRGEKEALDTVLYNAAEALRIVGGLLHPVMPSKMSELLGILGLPAEAQALAGLRAWGGLKPGSRVRPMVSLFPRIQERPMDTVPTASTPAPAHVEPAAPVPAAPAPAPAAPGVTAIDYTDFSKVQLKTARILAAERVEKADRLLRLQIDVGGVPRQIVAGIAQHYAPETLVGRTIVVVANLKPARIRGVESNGMLLAATGADGRLRLVTVEGEIESGAGIK